MQILYNNDIFMAKLQVAPNVAKFNFYFEVTPNPRPPLNFI